MPGELGNEEESNIVGYYEKRYPQSGEWMDPSYGKARSWDGKLSPSALKVVREMQEKPDAKSK